MRAAPKNRTLIDDSLLPEGSEFLVVMRTHALAGGLG